MFEVPSAVERSKFWSSLLYTARLKSINNRLAVVWDEPWPHMVGYLAGSGFCISTRRVGKEVGG